MSVIKSGVIYTIGDVFVKIIPFILLPYMARKMGIDGYGELSYIQFYISLFSILCSMTQGGTLTRYYYFYGKRSIGLILSNAYVYTVFVVFLLLLITILANKFIFNLAIIAAFTTELISSQLMLRICKKKTIEYICINVLVGMFSLAMTFYLFENHLPSIENRLISIIVPNSVLFLISLWYAIKKDRIRMSFSFSDRLIGFKYLLLTAIPLSLLQISALLKGQVDRLFIYEKYTAGQLGVYSAAFQLAAPLTIIVMSFNNALLPRYYERLRDRTLTFTELKKWIIIYLFFLPILYFLSTSVPDFIFAQILGKEVPDVKYFFSMFIIGNATLPPYLILSNYYVYFGKMTYVTIASTIGLVIYIIYLFALADVGIHYIPFGVAISNITTIVLLIISEKKINSSFGSAFVLK